jgi:hypothetical protein
LRKGEIVREEKMKTSEETQSQDEEKSKLPEAVRWRWPTACYGTLPVLYHLAQFPTTDGLSGADEYLELVDERFQIVGAKYLQRQTNAWQKF